MAIKSELRNTEATTATVLRELEKWRQTNKNRTQYPGKLNYFTKNNEIFYIYGVMNKTVLIGRGEFDERKDEQRKTKRIWNDLKSEDGRGKHTRYTKNQFNIAFMNKKHNSRYESEGNAQEEKDHFENLWKTTDDSNETKQTKGRIIMK